MTASTMRWPLLALIGLLVAIAVGLLATRLVSERIGISAEPISAGESLAPNKPDGDGRARRGHRAVAPGQTTSTGSDLPGSASSDAGSSDSSSRSDGSDGGDAKQGGRGSLASPPAAANPAPSSGGAGTTPEPEPGDD